MASITREKAIKWDETAKKYGDFRFDLEYYVLWGEKALIKNIKHEDGTYTQHKIRYASSFSRERGDYTEYHTPVYIIDKLVPTSTEGVYHVIEAHREAIGEATAKKNYNNLCKLSANINIEGVA